jgi:hypothetical protein
MEAGLFWTVFAFILIVAIANRYRRKSRSKRGEIYIKATSFIVGGSLLLLFLAGFYFAFFVGFPE